MKSPGRRRARIDKVYDAARVDKVYDVTLMLCHSERTLASREESLCHSERSEESFYHVILSAAKYLGFEILHFVQDDTFYERTLYRRLKTAGGASILRERRPV